MNKLQLLVDKLKQHEENRMERLLLVFIKANETIILDFNTQQLLEGNDALGAPLDPPYRSAAYANFKLHLNPKGVVDLKVTGDFHGSFFLRADKFPVTVFASDIKTSELLDKYGDEIFGIQKKNLEEFARSYILPDLQQYFRNLLLV